MAAVPKSSPAATCRTASAVEAAATTAASGSASRRKLAHWAVACGCETHRAHLVQLERGGRDQAVMHRVQPLADDHDVVGGEGERVERRVDRAFERVLDRHQRAIDRVLVDGQHRGVQRRLRHQVGRGIGRPERLVGHRAGRTEEADTHQSSVTEPVASPASASRIASCSSGESSCSPAPSVT